MSVHRALLHRLAAHAGIATEWRDVWGKPHTVPADSLIALLDAMGVPAQTEAIARVSLKRRARSTALPAALVVDSGKGTSVAVPDASVGRRWTLSCEDGRDIEGELTEGERALTLPALPDGYHRLRFADDGETIQVIASPGECHLPVGAEARDWGLATQLYGLRTPTQWGIGDFTDLGTIGAGVAARGGSMIGVNPLHALFPAAPHRISPYSPSSRLFLNPLYIDVTAVPDLAACEPARQRIASSEFGDQLAHVQASELVEYPAVARLKAGILRLLWRSFRDDHLASTSSERGQAFRRFQQELGQPLVRFAQFHALQSHHLDHTGFAWKDWPDGLRSADGADTPRFAAAHEDEILYHQYLQWEADRQLGQAARTAGLSIGIYRDLAIGADPYGADTWSAPDSYITGASVGAPPDLLNRQGQNWGLTAYSPLALRTQAYQPFIAALRANMRHAGALRIDHVMGLKQLYLVPEGQSAERGAYIRYPFEDMVRILALESRRNRCLVVGEDLGTVPHAFRPRMARAKILSCRILMFERGAGDRFKSPTAYPPLAAAGAGTHDLPPLKSWWQGVDIHERAALGLYPTAAARHRDEAARALDRHRLVAALRRQDLMPPDLEAKLAEDFHHDLIAAVHRFLARTPSALLLVQAEDLLGIETMVNLPGTMDEHPNWRRRLPIPIAELLNDARFAALSALRSNPDTVEPRQKRHG
ncbi:MAG TPA: 4-alpha-glucanotransferase [Aliidongia sp.]|uniref:4-alpha-glucanotransferase n=1 Tax=Aliidongia sp. TaxID=1914230 RepID=UPI002DDDBA38|nr:4-alpha-glucanotransferase [Aliidongia sp.]HEV2675621.1 4-alpha-glucanotransferase [Aliidongia sp.]